MTDDKMNAVPASVLAIRARIAGLLGDYRAVEGDPLEPGLDRKAKARLRRVQRRCRKFHKLPRARRTAA
jgi:hypothetical protein